MSETGHIAESDCVLTRSLAPRTMADREMTPALNISII
jgi:hypothetical protein